MGHLDSSNHPKQSDLNGLQEITREVRVIRVPNLRSGEAPRATIVLGEFSTSEDLLSLFTGLEIDESVPGGWTCATWTEIQIEFLPSGDRLMTMYGDLRWMGKWYGDAQLLSPRKILEWFSDRGLGNLKAHED